MYKLIYCSNHFAFFDTKYRRNPVNALCRGPKNFWKMRENVHNFEKARLTRTGHNMVKYSSPNAPST